MPRGCSMADFRFEPPLRDTIVWSIAADEWRDARR
jgi:hypothetical protein